MNNIYGLYFCCCYGNYLSIVKEQIEILCDSGLYNETKNILFFVTLYTTDNTELKKLVNQYDNKNKFIFITSEENLYEKFAINNYKKYISNKNYYLYYFHTKGISRNSDENSIFSNRRKNLNFYTISKYKINLLLLKQYDAVGCSLSLYPLKHFSGNFWWSTSDHLNKLKNVNNGYLSPEMYICSEKEGKYISLSQTTNDGIIENHINKTDSEILNNLNTIPIKNTEHKDLINMCYNNELIVIFDLYGGLCNQFLDIYSAVNFCLQNNIKFSIRYCSFRNKNLNTWRNVKLNSLFDLSLLKYFKLYIDFEECLINELTNENTYNFDSSVFSFNIYNKETIVDQLKLTNFSYIVVKSFFSLYNFNNLDINVYEYIKPCKNIFDKYIEIKNKLFNPNEKYNYIHYRYEKDFTNHFKINYLIDINDLIINLQFKDNSLKIFIGSSNIKKYISKENINKIILKDENDPILENLNYEEKAYIDFLFGLNSEEIFGDNRSSFSTILNNVKNTKNFYNILST